MAPNNGTRPKELAAKKASVKPAKAKRVSRSSFEIAEDYIELNFKPIIDIEKEEQLSKKELKAKRKAEKKAKKQSHVLRNSLIVAILLIMIAITTGVVWWNSSNEPVDIADKNARQFVVDEGATASEVAEALQKAGFIRSTLAFRIYTRLNGNVIQAGSHMLSPSYTMAEIVEKLATADTDEIDIQIPPGLTLNELRQVFKRYDYTDAEIERALTAQYDNPILASRPAGATLEGYLYPDTYRVFAGDDLEVLIQKALDRLEEVAKENNLEAGFAAQGLDFYQGLTLASIVTMEVQNGDDQKMVASVFYNRLAAGMNLGSDVTYMYAYEAGLCDANTPDCQSAYNTRIYEGLPPGPIANPSLTAMMAVAQPDTSSYYYFVAGEDGNTYFSETMDQHNQAVADHCGDLCR